MKRMIERAREAAGNWVANVLWAWEVRLDRTGRALGRFRAGINWTSVLAFLGLLMLAAGLYLVFGLGIMLIVMGVIFLGVAVKDAWQPGLRPNGWGDQ